MSDTPATPAATGPAPGPNTGDATDAPAKPSRRRRLLLIAAPVVVLAAAGGGWLAFRPAAHGAGSGGASAAEPAYLLLDPITVNLKTGDGRPRFLRVKLALELRDASVREHVHARLPVILDAMLVSMRELTPDDVTGSAGLYRIKEELLIRAHAAIGPDEVRRVLVQEVVQQ